MGNTRNAGRKRKFDPETVQEIVTKYNEGRTVSALAAEYGVSRQTMSFYIHDISAELEFVDAQKGSLSTFVHSLSYWRRLNKDFQPEEDLGDYRMRLDYMLDDDLMTAILVDFKNERILVKNYTDHPLKRAFGVKKMPTWEDFTIFLEDRCVPKTRDHMKLILKDFGLDFFNPLSIIKRTNGRMAEDNCYIKMIQLEVRDEMLQTGQTA